MGGGGHHHEEPFKVPHYSKYNNWKECPELVEYSKRLEASKLKDPWIRSALFFIVKPHLT